MDLKDIPEKEEYSYDDIINLGVEDKKYTVNKTLGQHFVAVNNTYPYTINPYSVLNIDQFLEKNVQELITTTNQNLLMNSGVIKSNIIYLCTAKNVLRYISDKPELNISEKIMLDIYYPYLIEKKITSLEMLEAKEESLLKSKENKISKNFLKNNTNINMFYDIYSRTKELSYEDRGIKTILFTIHPEYTFQVPLDIIFKLIHASSKIPFIKYNPGKRQEKIYRLYTDTMSTNGKKIPFLNKSVIFKLIKRMGQKKSVAVYIEHKTKHKTKEMKIPIICQFEEKGDITINIEFPEAFEIKETENYNI